MCTSVNNHRPDRARTAGLASLLAGCSLLGGCTLGPNFHSPPPPALDHYTAQTSAWPAPRPVGSPLAAGGVSQTIEPGRATDPDWWRQFGSPALNDLVAAGLRDSPTVTSATQALQQSRALARAGAGVFFPQVNASASAMREHTSPAQLGEGGSGSTFSLFTMAGSISYALDLFGGERRTVEGLRAQADYQRHALGVATLLLTGSIVNAAIARAGYYDNAQILRDILRMDTAQRDMLTARFNAGYGAFADVLVAEQQLSSDGEALAINQQRLAAATTLLTMLMGREPAEQTPPPPALAELAVPMDLPVSLPSQLVRQRPDILEAEATLHQTSAQIGVATAALFPSISLTGSYGAASTSLAHLAGPAGQFWSVGPSVDIPIFHGGQLWYGRRAAQAANRKALADYRQTVLTALEQVADSLTALDADTAISAANRSAFDAAELNHTLAEANLQAGVIAGFDAMTLALQADRGRLGVVGAKAQRLQDVAALYLASGGGWSGTPPAATPQPAAAPGGAHQ